MTKYDNLDARTELEQSLTIDLTNALGKRGFDIQHNGASYCAPGGVCDIQAINDKIIINVEITKSKKSSQDREFQSIRDHLLTTKKLFPRHNCYCIFVSPETSQRTIESIKDFNQQRQEERKKDLRILPLDFKTCELYIKKLSESDSALYPVSDLIDIFSKHKDFIDDLRIRKLIIHDLFPEDDILYSNIRKEETEFDEKTLEELIKDLTKIEDYMRENGIATSSNAIDNLIFLVFLKLYEEKREKDKGYPNRLRSAEAFENYRKNLSEGDIKKFKAIHVLFNTIKNDKEFKRTKLFTDFDQLRDEVDDLFIIGYILPIFSKYNFYGTKVDALGAVYEVLALRADKDVKVGQFFTPENVVKFMVKLADLSYSDTVLDPACGTGRFLIHAMDDMQSKLNRANVKNKQDKDEHIRQHQCFGADIDTRIAKIAKMNMWIHGDGKSNIFGGRDYNGLLLFKKSFNGHSTFDNNFDVVLTNPPLGELNYQTLDVSNSKNEQLRIRDMLTRIPILPKKNLTQEKLQKAISNLDKFENELILLENDKNSIIEPKDLKKIESKIKSKKKIIEGYKDKIKQLEAEVLTQNSEYEITGNNLKGGAMFITAIWHYLKDISNPDELPEWKGGKMLIILDEGVLNTDDYKDVRQYISSHFFIKAVVSLTRDTFIPISKTATKTSILFLVKKTDQLIVQKEPIFFAHSEKVGMDTKGKICENDLDSILHKYNLFKNNIFKSYKGLVFNKEIFVKLNKA